MMMMMMIIIIINNWQGRAIVQRTTLTRCKGIIPADFIINSRKNEHYIKKNLSNTVYWLTTAYSKIYWLQYVARIRRTKKGKMK